jgi:hypothetical protein
MTKQDKVAKVMHEWKNGRLTSNGKKVTDYDQAIAIALSEAGLSKNIKKDEDMNEYSKGGNVIERRYVNKDEDYETRYAKDKPSRMGYKDERMFAEGGETGKKLKGYRVYVFESSLSSSDNALKGDSYVLVTDGIQGDSSQVDSDEVYLKLVKRHIFGKDILHAEPVNINRRGNQMFGGKFVWSTDSRFRNDISEQPIQLHDRFESYAVGGEIGNTVSFKGDYGTPRSGVVKEKRGSSYIVSTDDGDRLVDSYEVISFSETPIAKKKRFGFFAEGGSIESKKQAILDFINSFPDKPKDWSEATDDLPELHYDIADEYGSKYDFDFNKRSSLRDRNLRHKQHAKSLLNKLSDEEIDKIYSKWEETLEDKFEGGGEIQSKIDKLQAVVNSKMLPESVKAKAQAEIDKLEKQLHADSVLKKSETYHEEGKDVYGDSFYQWHNISFEGDEDIFAYSTPKGTVIYGEDSEGEKDFNTSFTTEPYYLEESSEEDYSFNTLKESKVKAFELLKTKKLGIASKELHESKETKAEEKEEEKAEDYVEAKVKNLEASLKDKTISETQRKRDEKELALFKKATATTKKPTTRKAPIKKVVAKKVVVKKEVKGDLPKSKFEKGDKVGVSGDNEVYEIKDKSYRNNIEGELTWVYYLPEYSSVLVSEKNLKVVPKPKADHKKLVAKLKAKKGGKEYDNRASLNTETGERRKRNEGSDKKRDALPLGKRVSADGNTYWENRLNRGDLNKEDKFKDGGEVKGSGWGLNLNW